jgi:hypothetical protein
VKKVFFIGMNKTATKAFDFLFSSSGYMTTHYSCANADGSPAILAQVMKDNHESFYPIMLGLEKWSVFSDMFWHREDEWIDGVKYFREIHQQYPDAYFVLQTRDLDSWLKSKRNHKEGKYIERVMEYLGGTEEQVLDWLAKDREDHHRKVLINTYK